MWIFKLIKEYREWKTVYSLTSQSDVEDYLFQKDISIDWIGRMYTVIDVPEEYRQNKNVTQGYVLDRLRDLDNVLSSLNISDLILPDVKEIRGTFQYIVLLSTRRDRLNFWSITLRLIGYGGSGTLIYYNFDTITEWFNYLIGLF